MRTAELGGIILIADMSGDRPAIITKVFSNTSVEACAFTPLPEHVKVATIHEDRRTAINASQRSSAYQAYWPEQPRAPKQ